MSTNLIQIPQDVLIHDILDQLEIPDLIHILTTNKELRNRYLNIFEEKIEDYREDLRHRKEVVIPKYMQKIENYQARLGRLRGPNEDVEPGGIRVLDERLAKSMSVDNLGLPKFNGKTLYYLGALYLWWQIYVRDNGLIHFMSNNEVETIRIDDLMSSLVNIPSGTITRFDNFIVNLRIAHSRAFSGPLSNQDLVALDLELEELAEIWDKYSR